MPNIRFFNCSSRRCRSAGSSRRARSQTRPLLRSATSAAERFKAHRLETGVVRRVLDRGERHVSRDVLFAGNSKHLLHRAMPAIAHQRTLRKPAQPGRRVAIVDGQQIAPGEQRSDRRIHGWAATPITSKPPSGPSAAYTARYAADSPSTVPLPPIRSTIAGADSHHPEAAPTADGDIHRQCVEELVGEHDAAMAAGRNSPISIGAIVGIEELRAISARPAPNSTTGNGRPPLFARTGRGTPAIRSPNAGWICSAV